MISSTFNAVIFRPLYNGLIFLIEKLPFLDAGVVIVIFTIITKIILLPLSIKASKSQIQMKAIEKDLNFIKEKYKDDKAEQSKQTIEYYKKNNINPFAGFFVLLIQLPIIWGIYKVFLKSGLPEINTALLYPFLVAPVAVNMMFLGLLNIAEKSMFLALLAGITTYLQFHFASNKPDPDAKKSIANDVAKMMSVQMKYIFPVIVVFISYSISGALSLYWITNNIFSILQEIYIKKKYHQTPPVVI